MSPERHQAIIDHHPRVFPDGRGVSFEVGEGWVPLLLDLFEALEAMLETDPLEAFRITQIKEKWGSLRVYTHPWTDRIGEAVQRAEERSETTCEGCGRPGTRRSGGWIRTLCDPCEARYQRGERA